MSESLGSKIDSFFEGESAWWLKLIGGIALIWFVAYFLLGPVNVATILGGQGTWSGYLLNPFGVFGKI